MVRLGAVGGIGAAALALVLGGASELGADEFLRDAAARCRAGDRDGAADFLRRAVRAGFGDVSRLRRDADLRPLRDHPVYQAVLAARDAADPRLVQNRLDEWRASHPGGPYRYLADPARRIAYVTSLDDEGQRLAREAIDAGSAHLAGTLFGGAPRHWLIVIFPTAEDAAGLLEDPHVGGVYTHRTRELFARDTGRCLRHELFHALHHAHMDELGQDHAPWIQEGLACLHEEFRPDGDGSAAYPPNDRDAIAADLARSGGLTGWREIAALDAAALRREAARAYPQLRSMFRFIAAEAGLAEWYRAYVEGFDRDPAGLGALERVLGEPLDATEARWRSWLREGRSAAPH